MSLESIYYVGQTISVLAVVVSLVFVGVQVRRAEISARIAAAETTHQRFAEWYQSQLVPGVADLASRAHTDFESFSASERYSYICNVMAILLAIQDAHRKWREGSLPDGLWRVWDSMALQFFNAPGCLAVWNGRKHWFDDAFQKFAQTKMNAEFEVSDASIAWRTPMTEIDPPAPTSDDNLTSK